ncbi:MAG: hypothetical protein VX438_11690, partial [Planctomycetota bacterium]|nr:hypothetical protein [Planctomycetota bacterium]
MTSLRFVGELPPWIGFALAILVAIFAWRYYNRESTAIPRHLKVALPLLRSLAFVLGILILTGPVLHHRTTIGELGKVKIFVDASNSITQSDQHMTLTRKLMIAKQHGWISSEIPTDPSAQGLKTITKARTQLTQKLEVMNSEVMDPTQITTSLREFIAVVEAEIKQFPDDEKKRLSTEIVETLRSTIAQPIEKETIQRVLASIRNTLAVLENLESKAIQRIESNLRVAIGKGNESVAAAIDLFDDSPRWRRIELALADGDLNLLERLRERHEVELSFVHPQDTEFNLESNQSFSFKTFLDRNSFTPATNLSRVTPENLDELETSVDSEESKTAIVLITDGQHNAGPSPIQTARRLGAQGNV